MAHPKKVQTTDLPDLLSQVNSISLRLEQIESRLKKLESAGKQAASAVKYTEIEEASGPAITINKNYESRVMEYGFAWISGIVYLFGIIFLMAYVRNSGYNLLAAIIGYGGTASLFLLSHYLRKSYPHLLSAGQITGLLLLYYVTFRLHFFSENPLVGQKYLAFLLLILTIGILVYYSIRKNNELMGCISMVLFLLSALFYNSTYICFAICSLTSFLALLLFSRKGWWRLLLFTLFAVYLSHVLWYLNNPVIGNPVKAIEEHQHNIIFLFIYASVFAATISIPVKKEISDGVLVSISIWNALGFTMLMVMMVVDFYKDNYTWIFLLITALCLLYAVLLKSRTERKFAPAFYACFGFMALSITVYGYSGIPEVYFFLALQSLLVVSMALWFRSKIIVIVNTILFVSILVAYLFTVESINHISFTFAFVALATARIMNWQKERLTLKTDMLRNVYLTAGFFTVLYALNYAVPAQYVTLSWTAFAAFYFIMSVVLSNVKYRWMAILTILASSLRLFLVDFGGLDTGYRVVAFLFFAIIALGVSIYYTKKIKKQA